jgi:hypothetical protein
MGGGSGLQAREARLKGEELGLLDLMTAEEEAQSRRAFDERRLATEVEQAGLDRAQRASEAAATAQATIQKAYYDLQGKLSDQQMEMMSNALKYAQEDPGYATIVAQLGKTYKNDPSEFMRQTIAKLEELTGGYATIIGGEASGAGGEFPASYD